MFTNYITVIVNVPRHTLRILIINVRHIVTSSLARGYCGGCHSPAPTQTHIHAPTFTHTNTHTCELNPAGPFSDCASPQVKTAIKIGTARPGLGRSGDSPTADAGYPIGPVATCTFFIAPHVRAFRENPFRVFPTMHEARKGATKRPAGVQFGTRHDPRYTRTILRLSACLRKEIKNQSTQLQVYFLYRHQRPHPRSSHQLHRSHIRYDTKVVTPT